MLLDELSKVASKNPDDNTLNDEKEKASKNNW